MNAILHRITRLLLLAAVGLALPHADAQTAPAPPPAAPPQRSAADLEKLLAPIALYPDPLIASILPAAVYPLEIVQAARFVADTNNLAKLDAQSWDENVKAVARIPELIKKMNDDLSWTVDLGQAFLDNDKAVMDMIQTLRLKADKAGTLKTSPQQVVTVTNVIVYQTNVTQIVQVTNTVVQIQPSNPTVIYVPSYNPYTIYYPPPVYVGPPPVLTFAAGIAVGAILANNCNWYGGGIYGRGDVDIDINRNVNINTGNINTGNRPTPSGAHAASTKWQPDSARLNKSGATGSANTMQSRGWGSDATRPGSGSSAARPATGTAGTRPTTTPATTRPAAPATTWNKPATTPTTAGRPSTASPSTRPASPSTAQRPAAPTQNANRSQGSAFQGSGSGGAAKNYSNRGAASRGGGGGGGRAGRR